MPTPRCWSLLCSTAFATCTTPWPREPQVEVLSAPVHLSYDKSRTDWLWAGRVVDALTGRPIPNAVLHQVPELSQPEGGRFWSDGQWPADRDGFVRVPHQRVGGGWWFVQAPGYGPTANIGSPNEQVVPLMPGIDLLVAVRDNLDHPVAGAEVGYCIGCGHTPDVRVATTDASGMAVIRCIEPLSDIASGDCIRDLYVRHPGLSGGYDEFQWRLGDLPIVRRQGHVADVVGRVTSPDGRPLAGIAVGGALHRGPWTKTDRDGRFHHVGRESADDGLQFVLGETAYWVRLPATPRPIEVVLPPAEPPAERPTGSLSVTVRDARSGKPIEGARIHAWLPTFLSGRQYDDTTDDGTTDEDGHATLELVSGRFEVVIEAPDATHEPAVRRIEVTAGQEAHATVDLDPRTLVQVAIAGWVEPQVVLVTGTGEDRLETANAATASLPLPAHGPFALRVCNSHWKDERWFHFDTLPSEPLVLRPFAATKVRGRIVDAHGVPRIAKVVLAHHADGRDQHGWPVEDAAWLTTPADGSFHLATTRSGCAFLLLHPTMPGHRPRVVHLSLPQRGDDRVVDCGDLVLPTTTSPRLRVLRSDGSPATGRVRLIRPGLVDAGELADDGGWDGLDPCAGDRVTVAILATDDSDDEAQRVPLSGLLTGAGPWTLRQPDTRLTLDVRDDRGQPIADFAVVLGDREFYSHQNRGNLSLLDVPPGPLELFVSAEHLQSVRVRLTLVDGERRALALTLPHR